MRHARHNPIDADDDEDNGDVVYEEIVTARMWDIPAVKELTRQILYIGEDCDMRSVRLTHYGENRRTKQFHSVVAYAEFFPWTESEKERLLYAWARVRRDQPDRVYYTGHYRGWIYRSTDLPLDLVHAARLGAYGPACSEMRPVTFQLATALLPPPPPPQRFYSFG
jgi:hypothetical protein